MEHAKKMLLIDPSIIDKISQHNSVDTPISRLDSEMQKILKSNEEDRKKCILYLQTLQRFLHFTEEGRQPIEIPFVSNILKEEREGEVADDGIVMNKNHDVDTTNIVAGQTSNEDEKLGKTNFNRKLSYSASHILSLIPKTYTKKCELLLNSMSLNKNKIYWDDEGTVIIDKEKIPGSNILDLVNDSLRPLKRSEPIGWEKFMNALKEINIPLTYIGNPTRSDYIKQLTLKDLEEHVPQEEVFSTPTTGDREKHVGKTKRKIDWEKWTPY